tara:strand:+ start:113 stop:526 length:414 start_codon:yes stop_codon:yes gene_type:complete
VIQEELFEDFYSIPTGIETKRCNKCLKILPITSFYKHSGAQYLRPECNKCLCKIDRIRKELKKLTPPPPEDYRCPICGRNEEEARGKGGENNTTWVLDHCHVTDQVRGYLCHACNRAIGGFQDDVDTLKKAIEYLQK